MNLITLCNYEEYNPSGTSRGTSKGTDIIQEINKLKLEWAQLRTQLRAHPPETGHSEGTNTKKGEEENNKKEENKENSTKVEEKKKEESGKLAAAKAATLSRKDSFYNSLIPYVERYGKEMIREFYDYWSETNRSGTKMRFEQQPTWETAKRLATWAKREKFNGKPSYSVQTGGAYTPGKAADHKAASRQSLEDLANAILGEYQAENRP